MKAASPGRAIVFAAFAVVAVTAESVHGQAAGTQGVVAIVAAGQGDDDWSGATLGFVADSALVIAEVDGSERLFLVVAAADSGDTSYEAQLLAYDVASGLGLLSVAGLGAPPYTFALGTPRGGQEVQGIAWEPPGDPAAVAVARAFRLMSGVAVAVDTLADGGRGVIRHDALADGGRNVGGPLLNICDEVVGMVVPPGGGGDGSSTSEVATPASALLSRFEIDGLTAQVAAEACLSAEERREAEQEARLAQEAARMDSLEAVARVERARRAQAERAADSIAQASETATREATELREQRDSLEEQRDSLEQAARTTRETVRVRAYLGIAAAVVVILLVSLTAVRASRRAKRGAALARREADDSERKAAQTAEAAAHAGEAARAAAADLAARDARERTAGRVPEVLVERVGGPPMAVKIAGRIIAEERGAIIGRSPFASQVVLNHPEVSRKHFRLLARGTAVLVEDLGSTNGTILEGTRLQSGAPVPLGNGARLEIGGLSFVATMRRSGSAPDKNAVWEGS